MMAIGMVFDTQSKQGQPLVDALTPLLSHLSPLTEFPETASDQQIIEVSPFLSNRQFFLRI